MEARSNRKLYFRYFGLYRIIRAINPITYEVTLPEGSKIHPVFHVSQPRKTLAPGTTISSEILVVADDALLPVEVLDRPWRRIPTGRREQVLVRWSDPVVLDTTWEDATAIKHCFPTSPAWGQAVSQGGGEVSTPTTATPRNAAMAGETTQATNQGQNRIISRTQHIVQPKRRYMGPEWVSGKAQPRTAPTDT